MSKPTQKIRRKARAAGSGLERLEGRTLLSAPSVTIVATDAAAAERGGDTGSFTVTRAGDNAAADLTVDYAMSGSAVNGTDYDALSGVVTIPAGQTSAVVTLVPIDRHFVGGFTTATATVSPNADYTVGTPSSDTVTIAENDQFSGYITGEVFNDANGNGGLDTGETGLPGVTVNLLTGATVDATTTTAADGSYIFSNIAPGTYTVAQVVPAGQTATQPASGSFTFSLLANQFAPGVNFGDAASDTYLIVPIGGVVKAVNYVEADNTKVNVTLHDLTGHITLHGSGLGFTMHAGVTTIEGSVSSVDVLMDQLASIPLASSLTFNTTAGAGSGVADVGQILGQAMGTLAGKNVDIVGAGIDFTGFVEKITLRDLRNGAGIFMQGANALKPLTMAFEEIGAGSVVESGSGIASFAANEVAAGAAITAPWIGKLTTKALAARGAAGDFAAGLHLTGAGAPKGVALASAAVAGQMLAGNWQVDAGTVTSIAAASIGAGWSATVTGGVGKVASGTGFAGSLTAGTLGSLTTAGQFTGTLTLTGQDSKGVSLGTLGVGGTMLDATVKAVGIVTAVTLGAMDGSKLLIGTAAGVTGLAQTAADFASHPVKPSLGSLTIKGLTAGAPAFTASVIDAWDIGQARLQLVDTAAEASPFGVATDLIGSLTFLAVGVNSGRNVTLSKIHVASDLMNGVKNPAHVAFPIGEFTLQLV